MKEELFQTIIIINKSESRLNCLQHHVTIIVKVKVDLIALNMM